MGPSDRIGPTGKSHPFAGETQKLEQIKDTASREAAFLDTVAHGSAVAWQHLNLLGEYDFSDEKLRDSIGIRPPKLVD
jgi:hypothetical protein